MHNYEIIIMIESMMCSLGAIIIKILVFLVQHSCLTLITLNKKQYWCIGRQHKTLPSPYVPVTASLKPYPGQMANMWVHPGKASH